MELISSDLFTSILSYLPQESITALITNTNLDKAVKESAKTNIFWKQRVETLLGRYVDDVYPHWKLIHNQLIDDFKGKVDLKEFGSKALISASQLGHTEVVKFLLADDRVDPSIEYNKAIILASRYGHPEVVKLLLTDERVDPSAQNNDAIMWASKEGKLEVVKLLLADKRG